MRLITHSTNMGVSVATMIKFNEFLNALPDIVPDLHMHPLDYVFQHIDIVQGGVVELGVYQGSSITKIANYLPERIIYGFDSFEGLPESWDRPDMCFGKGSFDLNKNMPAVPSNVRLISGWFDDTLPAFAQQQCTDFKIALLHVDCDIYSSTKSALYHLHPFIGDGTVIVFDELFNYPTFENHELLAFFEFLQNNPQYECEWIGKNGKVDLTPTHDNGYWDQPAAVRILARNQ